MQKREKIFHGKTSGNISKQETDEWQNFKSTVKFKMIQMSSLLLEALM